MPNRSTDSLFQLVKSLEKSEKRNFRLYVTRNTDSGDLKVLQLFDAMDKMNEYNEETLFRKNAGIKKQQLSNIKASLYQKLLASLRVLRTPDNIDIQLHEQLDYARILYNKGLYLQSLKILEKAKETAKVFHQISLLPQVLFLEKKIEGLHITRSLQDRADVLSVEADEANKQLVFITKLSNLSLQLYSWYIKNGLARNEGDAVLIKRFFDEQLPADVHKANGFYGKLYLYQCYSWYAFIRQDFLLYYRYTQKWVDLFEKDPFMIEVETAHYIKGVHNLLGAHFDLHNNRKFKTELAKFEAFAHSDLVTQNDNNRIQTFVYIYISKINQHFMEGTFAEGLSMVPLIEEKLKEYALYLDRHRVLVFYYKIASLYFGSGDYETAIDYLNKIINWKGDLRTDLQCYARLLHLIAHYELGNEEILEHLIKSVYRFMAKMESLSVVEEDVFLFLKASFRVSYRKIQLEFEKLLHKLKSLESNRYETRAFLYLDICSWLESKLYKTGVDEIIRRKFAERMALKQ